MTIRTVGHPVLVLLLFAITLSTWGVDNAVYIEDPLQKWELEDLLEESAAFVPFNEFTWDTEAEEIVVWMRFPVVNEEATAAHRFVRVGKGQFWKAELFVLTADASPMVVSRRLYSVLEPENDPIETVRAVGFPVTVPPHSSRVVYLRLKTYNIADVPVEVVGIDRHMSAVAVDRIATGALFGLLIGVLVYVASIVLSIRERAFTYYLGFLVAALLYVAAVRRVGTGILYRTTGVGPWAATGTLSIAALAFLVLFTRAYLNTRETMPPVHHVLTAVLLVAPVALVANAAGVSFSGDLDWIVIITSIGAMGTAGVIGIVRRRRDAVTYTIALILFFVTAGMSFLYDVGVRPTGYALLFQDAVQYGVVACVLLMSLGVSHSVALLREERLRATEAETAKTVLLATVSHELRTPLSNVWMLLARLRDNGVVSSPAEAHRIIDAAERHLRRLTTNIDNLLRYSRVGIAELMPRLRNADLGAFVTDHVADARSRADDAGVTLSVEAQTVWTRFDRDLLASLVDNLVDNALRAVVAGGEIALRLTKAEGEAILTVDDSGPGVPAAIVPRLFEDKPGETEGLGIGLPLCRRIAAAHGGTIAYEPPDGERRGARFVVAIPIVSGGASAHVRSTATAQVGPGATAPTVPPTATIPAAGSGVLHGAATILLVEDDDEIAENVTAILTPRFVCRRAADADAADLLTAEHRFDAVVVDVMMPGEDGFSWVERFRRKAEHRDVPVLFLTALADDENALRGLTLGAVDYLRKPVRPAELFGKLEAIVATHRAVSDRLKEGLISFIDAWPHRRRDNTERSDTAGPAHTLDFDYLKSTYSLTERQAQVLNLVLQGHTDREIAGALSISIRTVGYHVSAILRQVGVERRTQLRYELLENTRLETREAEE